MTYWWVAYDILALVLVSIAGYYIYNIYILSSQVKQGIPRTS